VSDSSRCNNALDALVRPAQGAVYADEQEKAVAEKPFCDRKSAGGGEQMTTESRTVRCPECGRRQRYMADEWPDDCVCGHKFVREEKESDEND